MLYVPGGRPKVLKKFYDILSRLEVTMATPTLANARKPYHQLSSCFIDTVPDSLEGIYRSLDNFAISSSLLVQEVNNPIDRVAANSIYFTSTFIFNQAI